MSSTGSPVTVRIGEPALIILVGASGSGKSWWASENFLPNQVVSSDALRAAVGEGEHDLGASANAFALLREIVRMRTAAKLTVVVDTLGTDASLRTDLVKLARGAGLAVHAVVLDAPERLCRDRNATRSKPVPATVLSAQMLSIIAARDRIAEEDFDGVHIVTTERPLSVRVVGKDFVSPRPPMPIENARTQQSPVRFGLQISSFPGDAATLGARLQSIGKAAEAAGFSSVYVMDHFRQIPQLGRAWDQMLESTTALAFLAAATSRVRIGALVNGITHRNLGVLGKAVATLDVVSGGRAICGLGLGWFQDEHRAFGLRLPSVAERYELLNDALDYLPTLWGKGNRAFEGRRFSSPDTTCYPRPLQAHLPILVGGSGERQTLRAVARAADACNLFGSVSTVTQKLGVLAEHCATLHRDRAAIEVTHLSTAVVGETVHDLAGRMAELRIPPKRAAAMNPGTVGDHVERSQLLAQAGVNEIIVSLPNIGETVSEHESAISRYGSVISATLAGVEH